MSKVSTESIYLGHDIGTFNVEVTFSVRKKVFCIELPETVKKTLGYGEVFSETFDGVKQCFSDAIKEFNSAHTISRKVIVYEFKATAFMMDEKNEICVFREDEVSFAKGTALDLWFQVLEERKILDRTTYHNLDGGYEFEFSENLKIMDWTEQREQFFKTLERNLQQTIKNAHMFFNSNTNDVMRFIDTGGKPLLPSPKEEP